MIKKYKKGDEVIVKVGKDRGKIGKISKVFNANDKVIINGVNVSKKHQKPSQDSKGGIIDKEMPIHISNILAYDSKSKKSSKVGFKIQEGKKNVDGIIINAAGFTHTSVSIRDALDIFKKPLIELHISNIYKREEFRRKSLISDVVTGGIFGLGSEGYILAIISMQKLLNNENW